MNQIYIERLKTLYAMMAGIPDHRVSLSAWTHSPSGMSNAPEREVKHACGSTACLLGWAAMYPEFKEQGLSIGYLPDADCNAPKYVGGGVGFAAGAQFFGLTSEESDELFAGSTWRDREGSLAVRVLWEKDLISQKQIALRRVRRLLLSKGAITKARNAELALQEGTPE